MVRYEAGQPTILLEPRLLKLGREAVEATLAHELGHVALGHVDPAHRFDCRFGDRWTMRDEALAALSWATMLLIVPGGVAYLVAGRSIAALIAPVVLSVAVNLPFAAGRAPARHSDEYDADAYAVRLLRQCDSTLALLAEFAHQRARSRPRFAPRWLVRMGDRLDGRIATHPQPSARIEHLRTNVALCAELRPEGRP